MQNSLESLCFRSDSMFLDKSFEIIELLIIYYLRCFVFYKPLYLNDFRLLRVET